MLAIKKQEIVAGIFSTNLLVPYIVTVIICNCVI